jgi:hypothetical protein
METGLQSENLRVTCKKPQDTGNVEHDCGLRTNKMQSKCRIWKLCKHETEAAPHRSALEQASPSSRLCM